MTEPQAFRIALYVLAFYAGVMFGAEYHKRTAEIEPGNRLATFSPPRS